MGVPKIRLIEGVRLTSAEGRDRVGNSIVCAMGGDAGEGGKKIEKTGEHVLE